MTSGKPKNYFSPFFTKLSTLDQNFDASCVVFRDGEDTVKKDGTISGYKIPVGFKNPDGSEGHLLVALPPGAFTYGLRESKKKETGEHFGYFMSIQLWNDESSSEDVEAGKAWIENYRAICATVRTHVETFDFQFDEEKKAFEQLGQLYPAEYPGASPSVTCNLRYSKQRGVATFLRDSNDALKETTIDKVLGKRAKLAGTVEFEQVFVSPASGVSLRMAANELRFAVQQSRKEYLPPPLPLPSKAGASKSSLHKPLTTARVLGKKAVGTTRVQRSPNLIEVVHDDHASFTPS